MTTSPKVDLRNPLIAGILAFLLPGAGHCYQGRFFKAFVFAICVWGSWWTGMAMSDWKALQAPNLDAPQTATVLKFAGQAGVGTPALWAMYQSHRFYHEGNLRPESVNGSVSIPFSGRIEVQDGNGIRQEEVDGTLSLSDTQGQFGPAITGKFEGEGDNGPVSYQLDDKVTLDRIISSERDAEVSAGIVDAEQHYLGNIRGTTPRALRNWFACPLDKVQEANWHRERGKYQELSMVFVWIAGLMNLLAIWDAVEGPAYGYDDEDEQTPSPVPAA
jgi:hypothetical protein